MVLFYSPSLIGFFYGPFFHSIGVGLFFLYVYGVVVIFNVVVTVCYI